MLQQLVFLRLYGHSYVRSVQYDWRTGVLGVYTAVCIVVRISETDHRAVHVTGSHLFLAP